MKKFAIGCGIIVLLLAVAGGAGVWYITNKVRGYAREFQALADADKRLTNTSAFTPPASGELSADMVQRFAAVQDGMHARLGQRVAEITAKQDEFVRRMHDEGRKSSSPLEAFTVVKDMMGLIIVAKNAQIDALNDQHFSLDEYDWVRGRVYTAAGVSVTELSFRNMSDTLKQSGDLTKPIAEAGADVPAKNKELVKPLLPKFKDWAPLAFFGM
jgi:hypothetical protein